MILILGNNQWTRHSVLLSLFMKKYYVAEQTIDDSVCITKPFLTAYINPTISEINKIKNENTICVVAKNDLKIKVPAWIKVIPCDDNIAKRIMEIYDDACPYGKGREVFGILGLEGKKFTIGGAYVHMTPKQLKAIKILLYNPGKKFSSYDISSYFDYIGDAEEGFFQMVQEINYQCKRAGREKLIFYKENKYYISPDVLNY